MEKQFEILDRVLIKIMTVLMFLFFLSNVNAQTTRFGLVELNDKYEKDIDFLNDNNSCSVRLIASFFNIEYDEAYKMLEAEGRKHGEGASITKIVKAFNKANENYFVNEFYDVSEKRGITLTYFLKNYAQPNTDYIIIQRGHIVWLKVGEMSKNGKGLLNTLYGNEGDRGKNMIVYLPIKKR